MPAKHSFTSLLRRVRVPFRTKVIAPFIVLGLVLTLAAALAATQIVFENYSERFANQLLESGKLAAEMMVVEENRLLEGLRLLAYTQGVPQAVLSRDADRLRELTFPLAVNQQLEEVEILDAQGNLLFSMRQGPDGSPEQYQFASEGGASFSNAPFVRQALAGQADARGDKFAGLIQVDRREYFFIAGPIYGGQNQVVGAVLAGAPLDQLAGRMRRLTLAQVTLYYLDGSPLASTFPNPQPVDEAQAGQVISQAGAAAFQRQMGSSRQIDVLNTGYEELLVPWRARGETIGILGVSLFRNVLINPSVPTRIQVVGLISLVLILTILAGWLIANAVTRPLAQLTQASREVSRGDLSVQIPLPGSNDELADLAGTFNDMVASLSRAQTEIVEAYDNTLLGWSQALEMRERDTASHSQRVTEWTLELARALGLEGEALTHIRRGALLHDIGKMAISDDILLKPGPLSDEEFAVMKQHPVYAMKFLSPIEHLRPALEIPYCHHEKWDGSGYPRGLKGEEIPLSARIFAVVDVWDAVSRDRVYHGAVSPAMARRIIEEGRGTHFDPRVVDAFLELLPSLEAKGRTGHDR